MSSEIIITIRQTNGDKQSFEIAIQSDLTILELKIRIKEFIQIPEDKQNLIYKGHILFDNKKLEDYHIISHDTILLVEKIGEQNKQPSRVPNVNLQSGVGAPGQINYDLLRQPMGGANINFEQLEQIMQRPEIAGQFNEMLGDPNVINAMLDNPQIKPLLDANPFLRQQMSNPEFLRNIFNPESLRMMRQLQENGPNLMGNPLENSGNNMGGMGGMNPYMNPLMFNPYMNPMMGNFNYPGGGFGGMNNNMTNEQLKEKYKNEIQQLKEMGFDNEENNLKALIKSNGNVEAAVGRLIENNF